MKNVFIVFEKNKKHDTMHKKGEFYDVTNYIFMSVFYRH